MRRIDPEIDRKLREHKDRAAELASRGQLEAAVAEYVVALRLAPDDVFSRQRVAEHCVRLGRAADAVAHYRCLAGRYASEGRLLQAIAACQIILQLEPAHGETQSLLGDLYARRDAPSAPVRIPEGMSLAMTPRSDRSPPLIDPETLERIPLFSDLGRGAFLSLLRRFRRKVIAAGETIVEEGEPGHAMFAIAHGAVHVERRQEGGGPLTVDTMGEGDFFGEMSLLSRCPRLATVSAAEECELLELGRDDLEEIVAEHPHIGEVVHRLYKERLLANVLRASPVFRQVPPEGHPALGDLFTVETHPAGALLLEQGQPGGALSILLRGTCEVFHRDHEGREDPYPPMREGDLFGEVSLLQGGPATACVRTDTPCVVLGLHRDWFDRLIHDHPGVRAAIYEIAAQRLGRTQQVLARELIARWLV